MQCPVCKHYQHKELGLQADGFAEALCTCSICGSSWMINHGLTEMVRDAQAHSFLAGTTECVEGDDYYLVA